MAKDACPEDKVNRAFTAAASDQLWVADITYVKTHSEWVYAAFILDMFSHRVVGWQVSTSLHTRLALDALDMALCARRRQGADLSALIHHSDRGVQYRAIRYTEFAGRRRGGRLGRVQGRLPATTPLPRRSIRCTSPS